jgi:hypothetical protein
MNVSKLELFLLLLQAQFTKVRRFSLCNTFKLVDRKLTRFEDRTHIKMKELRRRCGNILLQTLQLKLMLADLFLNIESEPIRFPFQTCTLLNITCKSWSWLFALSTSSVAANCRALQSDSSMAAVA